MIPIVHSRHDLGSLEGPINALKATLFSPQSIVTTRVAIDHFWQAIFDGLRRSDFDFPNLYVYQDGLPTTGDPHQGIELRIVEDLASKGSQNHRIIQWLLQQNAALVGTESVDLLMEEYELARRFVTKGLHVHDADDDRVSLSNSIRERRDQFIATRIHQTLSPDRHGLIFLGLLHRLEAVLPDDIRVDYPFGRPRSAFSA